MTELLKAHTSRFGEKMHVPPHEYHRTPDPVTQEITGSRNMADVADDCRVPRSGRRVVKQRGANSRESDVCLRREARSADILWERGARGTAHPPRRTRPQGTKELIMAAPVLTLEAIEKLSDELRKAPDLPKAKRVLTKKEAVLALKPAIDELRNRGYSVEQVANLLSEKGMAITFGSLRQYLADKQGGSRGKKKKGAASSAAASSATSLAGGTPQASRPANDADADATAGHPVAKAGTTSPVKGSGKAGERPAEKADDKKGPGFKVREDTKDI